MKKWDKFWYFIFSLFGVKVNKPEEDEDKPSLPAAVDAGVVWSGIVWQGQSFASASEVEVFLKSAKVVSAGTSVRFDYSERSPQWPAVSMGSVVCDAVAVFLWKSGAEWRGAKFDWIRKGGQSVKTLVNIYHEHYNGIPTPAPGTECGFAWVSVNGKRRSNIVLTLWP